VARFESCTYLNLGNDALQQAQPHVVHGNAGDGEVRRVRGLLAGQSVQHHVHALHEYAVLFLGLYHAVVTLDRFHMVCECLHVKSFLTWASSQLSDVGKKIQKTGFRSVVGEDCSMLQHAALALHAAMQVQHLYLYLFL
jgi:hypothetical protein